MDWSENISIGRIWNTGMRKRYEVEEEEERKQGGANVGLWVMATWVVDTWLGCGREGKGEENGTRITPSHATLRYWTR